MGFDLESIITLLIGTFLGIIIFSILYIIKRKNIEEKANKLLIEGFIKSNIKTTLANHFKKYWR